MSRFKVGDVVMGVDDQALVKLAEVIGTANNGDFIILKIIDYDGITEFNGETITFEACHFINSVHESKTITLIDGTETVYDYKIHTYLNSGKYCLKSETVKVEGKILHPIEFEELGVVVDYWLEYTEGKTSYRFKHNMRLVWISLTEKAYASNVDIKCQDTSELYLSDTVAVLHGRGYSELDCGWRLIENCREAGFCRDNCVEGYHAHTKVIDKSDNSVYTVGYEIEKEDKSVMLSLKAKKSRLELGWRKEADSSLNREIGFEFISPVFDLFDGNGARKADFENPIIAKHINAKYTSACGGHINLAERGKTTDELFEEISGYLPLLYAIYESRIHTGYSIAAKKKKYYETRDKHRAVYIKSKVLEFRIFPAVKSIVNLEWRTRLIQLMVMNKTNDPMTVVVMMANKKSDLFQHLSLLYSAEEILGKIKAVFKYMKEYNDVTPEQVDETFYNPTSGFEVTNPQDADFKVKSIINFENHHHTPIINDSLRVVPKQFKKDLTPDDFVTIDLGGNSTW